MTTVSSFISMKELKCCPPLLTLMLSSVHDTTLIPLRLRRLFNNLISQKKSVGNSKFPTDFSFLFYLVTNTVREMKGKAVYQKKMFLAVSIPELRWFMANIQYHFLTQQDSVFCSVWIIPTHLVIFFSSLKTIQIKENETIKKLQH